MSAKMSPHAIRPYVRLGYCTVHPGTSTGIVLAALGGSSFITEQTVSNVLLAGVAHPFVSSLYFIYLSIYTTSTGTVLVHRALRSREE